MTAVFDMDAASVRNLETVMGRYQQQMHRSAEYTVNRTLQNIAGWAAHETIMADRQKVAAELGATYRTTAKRTGATLKRPSFSVAPTTLAKARYVASLRRAGKPIPPEPVFSQNVRRMVGSILRSIAFMKAGWKPAYARLKRFQAEAALNESSAFGGRARPGYGDVTPAHNVSEGIEGEIANQSINKMDTGSWPALERYGGPALNRAIALKSRDMIEFLDRQHDKAAGVFNA